MGLSVIVATFDNADPQVFGPYKTLQDAERAVSVVQAGILRRLGPDYADSLVGVSSCPLREAQW